MLLDADFLTRIYRTSFAVWLLAILCCAALRAPTSAVGLTVGLGISFGSMNLLRRLVTTLFTPEAVKSSTRVSRRLFAVAMAKYAIIGVILWISLRFGLANPVAIAAGVGLPQAVIFFKALGAYWVADSGLGRRV